MSRKYRQISALVAAASAALVQFAHGAVASWDGGAGNNLFSAANWTTNGASGYTLQLTGDSIVFDAAGPTGLSNDLTGATFNGITFNPLSQAMILDGNPVTL